jgi:hypothetical protein
MELNKTQEIDLCAVIWIKVSEFESKYRISPNNVVLPLFVKEHLIKNLKDFGDTMITQKGYFVFMGLKVHWTMVNTTESIIVFETP